MQLADHLIAHIVLIVFNGLVAVCVELDHAEWAATAEDEERNDDPEKDFVELVLEHWLHLQLTRPVAYHCNVVVLQGATLADESALGHVILVDLVLCCTCFLVPTFLLKVITVSIEGHADSLVTEEVVLWVSIAKMKLEFVKLKVIESLGKQPLAFTIERVGLGEDFVPARELRIEHVPCDRVDFHEALLYADFCHVSI